MGSPLQNDRLCCVVCLRRRSRCARLQMSLMCHTRRSAASFVLLRTSMSSTNLRCLICRDEYTRRVFLPCSPTDVQRSQHRQMYGRATFDCFPGLVRKPRKFTFV